MVSGILKAVAKETGLICDTKRNIVHGSYQGYLVTVKEMANPRQIIVIVSAKQSNANTNESSESFLNTLKQTNNQVRQTIVSDYCMTVVLKMGIVKKAIKATVNTITEMVSFCNNAQMIPCCQRCGEENYLSVVSIDGAPNVLCNTCNQDIIDNIDATRLSIKSKKGNILGGIVGAFLGSLIGVVVWVLIYQMGYIAGITGLVFSICTIKGYEKLGGKLNIVGVIISLVISVGMLYIAENISLAIEIHRQFSSEYDITFFDAYKAIGEFMKDEAISRSVIGDLIMGYLFMAVASVSPIIQIYKSSNHLIEVTNLSSPSVGPNL